MRMLHTMLRVGDLEKSLRFYCEVLGMRLLRRKDYPSGRFTLAFFALPASLTRTSSGMVSVWWSARIIPSERVRAPVNARVAVRRPAGIMRLYDCSRARAVSIPR